MYAAEALTQSDRVATVDILDELPAPFGLLRYGVAPDHVKMKSLEVTLQRILDRPRVRFFGNVHFGRDVTRADLLNWYDAVIYASGAASERLLGIPGEGLAGSIGSRDFVAWYNGHPAAALDVDLSRLEKVAVIGAGNVALDVARVLAKPAAAFAATDVSEAVLRALRSSTVRDIFVIGRSGAAQARFTTKELREMGQLPGTAVHIDASELELNERDQQILAADPNAARNVEVMREWASRGPVDAARHIHFRFNSRPVSIQGATGSVEAMTVESHTGQVTLQVGAVFRCIGFFGSALPGLPFDPASGTVPNTGGRVDPGDREYVTGWARRGPRGVLGTNKSDSMEVVSTLLADLAGCRGGAPVDLAKELGARGVEVVTAQGWSRICAAERALGAQHSRTRIKICTRDELLTASRAAG